MKFSEAWLRTWVDPSVDSTQLAHLLTMGGLEVEALDPVAPSCDGVVVGRIVTVEKHPQADRLNCLTVDVGAAEPLGIVCGAPNVRVGMKAPCALVGAKLPGGLEIRAAKVRGIESRGMMCSARELGLAEDSQGLLELAAEALVGMAVRDWLELDDQSFTLKLTPNRADCLSLRGVAREVAALTGCAWQALEVTPVQPELAGNQGPQVVLEAAECARYAGRRVVLEHPQRATPDWMVRRLERSGLRPKCLVVDVTNYVMLELGQPMHAFDAERLDGDLAVRWARQGETLALLDGTRLELSEDLLVVADAQGPQALAGLMGGEASAVHGQSRTLFLESAWFAPRALAGRARRCNLTSESAYRFERGVDPGGAREALERATRLLLDVAGGQAGPITETLNAAALPAVRSVTVRAARVTRLLGFEVSRSDMETLLTRLGVQPRPCVEGWTVTAPGYRFDLEQEVDYVEEIARCYGYDKIPERTPAAALSGDDLPEGRRHRFPVLRHLNHLGFQEVITYSFVSAEMEAKVAMQPSPLTLVNPLSAHLSVMRSTLACGLLDTLQFNLKRKQELVRIFEWGRCFAPGQAEAMPYDQPLRLGGLWYGARFPQQWGQTGEEADFYDIKGVVESLLRVEGVTFRSLLHPALHPGRSAEVLWQGQAIGWLGELHPTLKADLELPRAPLLFELEWEPLSRMPWPEHRATPRFQPVRRDLALVLDHGVPAGDVLEALRAARCPGVVAVDLFDVYRGQGLAEGKKSLAFCVTIQDVERASTDSELDQVCRALIHVAEERFGAVLR